ncbi:Hypothetical protein MIP_03037 [Mycobacterium intracellulare subsp. intracellulare MTCC 9506]|uniref:Uncharacterized protein n=1 Tax=Mycobacterium indicus pranii (strain DSM 45239 / MTCC 9506) TaxID=1232724 RepID=J9WA62_MYCIP|nr:Hypothetical protein MIP_03037 [Mycobacterium intracellulare subsp. intracellulare MTCC 9506]
MGVTSGFGDAKVDQICEIVWRDNDVLRLYVTVNQSCSMGSV